MRRKPIIEKDSGLADFINMLAMRRVYRNPLRHVHPGCWCGSEHDWELGKHGYCDCTVSTCKRVHRKPLPGKKTY